MRVGSAARIKLSARLEVRWMPMASLEPVSWEIRKKWSAGA
jgi:hypothetical protein